MRISLVIIGLAAIAICLVLIRREEVRLRHELQKIQIQHSAIKRDVWDRHVELGHLLTPAAIKYRADAMALNLTAQSNAKIVNNIPAATPVPASAPNRNQRIGNDTRQ